jgi:hypothetical protein
LACAPRHGTAACVTGSDSCLSPARLGGWGRTRWAEPTQQREQGRERGRRSRPGAGAGLCGLGRAGEKRKGRGRGRGENWVGPKSQVGCSARREKREGDREKERIFFETKEKQPNLFELVKFKFNRKTNNKKIQCGMRMHKTYFPYISFYG